MASQRASITNELLRESLKSVLKPFKIHSLDDGEWKSICKMGRKSICKSTNWFWDAISAVKISDSSLASILSGRDVKSLYYQAS